MEGVLLDRSGPGVEDEGVTLVQAGRDGVAGERAEVGDDGLHRQRFRTSGNVVSVLTALSIAAYVSLLVLTLRLDAK